jgi:hypothetical protein
MRTEQIITRTNVGPNNNNGLKSINKLLSEGWKVESVKPIGDCLEYLLEREIIITPLLVEMPCGDDFFKTNNI